MLVESNVCVYARVCVCFRLTLFRSGAVTPRSSVDKQLYLVSNWATTAKLRLAKLAGF